MTSKTYNVKGMTCASCAQSVEKIISTQKGVSSANVSFADDSVTVEFDENMLGFEHLQKATQDIGYDLSEPSPSVSEEEKMAQEQVRKSLNRTIYSLIIASVVMILAMIFGDSVPFNRFIQMVLTAVILIGPGRQFFVNGFKRIKHLQTNMDTLVALSAGVAFLFSAFNTIFPEVLESRGLEAHVYFESAAVIVALILLGKFFEHRAKLQARSSLKSLMNKQPSTVTLSFYGSEKQVSISEVGPGDEIIVKTGERIPVDGVIKSGELHMDESMLTGESDWVVKSKKDRVFTGTIVEKGSAHIIAHKVGEETRLSEIIERVRKAQNSKAPVQQLADKISSVFVPLVIGISLITFALWILISGPEALPFAFNSLVSVLIIACPCALGLATPTAIMVGLGRGAEQGLLIQNAEIVQKASGLDTLVFDKTGTLTHGEPALQKEKWFEQSDELTNILVAIEKRSSHPLAEALVQKFQSDKQSSITVSDVEEVRGKGIKANFEGTVYFVGSQTFFQENCDVEASTEYDVYFFSSTKLYAGFSFSDSIEDGVAEVIAQLQDQNIEIHLLSGDRSHKVEKLAKSLNIEHYLGEVSPEEKSNYIEKLKADGHVVGMVGDGINDSIALASADISMAMGKGTDTAMDVAQVTLANGSIVDIPKVIALSKQTMKVIKQNLFWAFGYNIIAIPLAAGVFYSLTGWLLHPMFAGGAMAFSSVAVVLNSLRLKSFK